MGSAISTNDSIDTKLIDRIATDYILSMNFQDMMDMTTESGCGKMVLVVEDILKKNTTEVDLASLQNTPRGLFDLAAPPSGTSSIFVFPEGDEVAKKSMDLSDPKKKLSLCRNIAKFYVQVAHLFAAIIMTVNPKYQFTKDGETKKVGIMDRKDIPEESLKTANIILERNFCSERENILTQKSSLDDNNDLKIALPYCSLDEKIDPIGASRGIKELEDLFKDDYDTNTGIFSMNEDSARKYKQVVKEFYDAMYNTGTAPDTFSDIKIPKYHEERGCSETALQKAIGLNIDEEFKEKKSQENDADKKSGSDANNTDPVEQPKDDYEPPFKETYRGTNSGLYKDFKNNIVSMKEATAKNTNEVFSILGQLFDLTVDPITINPKITSENISPLIIDTREKITKLYLECEKNFQKGLELFRNIVYQNLTEQTKEDILSLEELQNNTLAS
jgi:hypothetical protein